MKYDIYIAVTMPPSRLYPASLWAGLLTALTKGYTIFKEEKNGLQGDLQRVVR